MFVNQANSMSSPLTCCEQLKHLEVASGPMQQQLWPALLAALPLLTEPLPSAEQQQQQLDTAEQQAELCRQQCQLLDAIQALLSVLNASSGGWCFLTAAKDGLAALAAAVCPSRQVCGWAAGFHGQNTCRSSWCLKLYQEVLSMVTAGTAPQVSLDGGPFAPDTSASYNPEHGWEAERQALAAASGLSTAPSAAAGPPGVSSGALALFGADEATAGAATAGGSSAGELLSESLQRLWLLVEATSQVQGCRDLLSGAHSGTGGFDAQGRIDRLNAALLTLYKVGPRPGGLGLGLVPQVCQLSMQAWGSGCRACRWLVALAQQSAGL
jgi:hypothetical protein